MYWAAFVSPSEPATLIPIFVKSPIMGRAIPPYLAAGVPNGTKLATAEVPVAWGVEPFGLVQPFMSNAIRRIMGRIRFMLSSLLYIMD
jgi:hypothetical protein